MKYKYDYDNLAIQAFNLFMSGNYNNIVRQILEVPSHVFLKVRRVLAVRLQHQGWTGPEIHRLINSRGKGICGNRDIPTGYSLEAIGITCYSSLLEWEASALAVQDAQNQYALAGLDEVKRRLYEVNNNKLLYSADKIDEAELYVFIHAKGMKIGSIPWECEMSGSISDIIGYISPNDIFNFGSSEINSFANPIAMDGILINRTFVIRPFRDIQDPESSLTIHRWCNIGFTVPPKYESSWWEFCQNNMKMSESSAQISISWDAEKAILTFTRIFRKYRCSG